MKLEGEIGETGLIEQVVALGAEKFTGALRFENDAIIKILYFKGGDVLSASTNDRADSVDEILLRAGKITREHIKQSLGKRKESETLGDAMLALGFITRKELTWGRRAQLIGILRSIDKWTKGSYTLVNDYLPKRDEGTIFSLPQLLLELLVTDPDREKVEKQLDSGQVVLSKTAAFAEQYPSLSLNEEADGIVSRVDGVRSASEIAASTSLDPFNVFKLLNALELLGLMGRAAKHKVLHEELPAVLLPGYPSEIPAGEGSGDGDADPGPLRSDTHLMDSAEPDLAIRYPDAPASRGFEEMPLVPLAPDGEMEGSSLEEAEGYEAQRTGKTPGLSLAIPLFLIAIGLLAAWFWHQKQRARKPEQANAPAVSRRVDPSTSDFQTEVPATGSVISGEKAALITLPGAAASPPQPGAAGRAPEPGSVVPIDPALSKVKGKVAVGEPLARSAAPVSATPPSTVLPKKTTPAVDPSTAPLDVKNDAQRSRYDAMAQKFVTAESAKGSAGYTLQLQLVCEISSITRALNGGAGDVWFAPTRFRGRSCYRLLWGRFPSREAAANAVVSVPKALSEGGGVVIPIKEVTH